MSVRAKTSAPIHRAGSPRVSNSREELESGIATENQAELDRISVGRVSPAKRIEIHRARFGGRKKTAPTHRSAPGKMKWFLPPLQIEGRGQHKFSRIHDSQRARRAIGEGIDGQQPGVTVLKIGYVELEAR